MNDEKSLHQSYMDSKKMVLITTTMPIGGVAFEHSTWYKPGSGDLKVSFEILRLAFERAIQKDENEGG